jgi:hypothetical protein
MGRSRPVSGFALRSVLSSTLDKDLVASLLFHPGRFGACL